MLVQSESAVVVRFSAARSTCGRWFQCGQQIQWSLILVRSARTMVVSLQSSQQIQYSLILVQPASAVVVDFVQSASTVVVDFSAVSKYSGR